MIKFENSFNHTFIYAEGFGPRYYSCIGPRYYSCSNCNIIVFIKDMFETELLISARNNSNYNIARPLLVNARLDLTCEEFIIKKLLE